MAAKVVHVLVWWAGGAHMSRINGILLVLSALNTIFEWITTIFVVLNFLHIFNVGLCLFILFIGDMTLGGVFNLWFNLCR